MEGTGGGGRAEVSLSLSLSGGISIALYLCQPFLRFFFAKEGHVLHSGGLSVGSWWVISGFLVGSSFIIG